MFRTEIEGSILTVCGACSKFGKVLSEVRTAVKQSKKEKTISTHNNAKKELIFLLVEDYAKKIKKQREYLGITQEEFAKKINEKVSILHQIETGKFTPSIKLSRKLEKTLNIKLVDQHEELHKDVTKPTSDELTIGDFIKIRKK